MKNLPIINIGKFFFWLSLLLGSIALFGYIFTRNEDFAVFGFFLLIYGTIVNAVAFFGLLLYGIFNSKRYDECLKSALTLLINIPIAFLYAWVGLSII